MDAEIKKLKKEYNFYKKKYENYIKEMKDQGMAEAINTNANNFLNNCLAMMSCIRKEINSLVDNKLNEKQE